MKVQIAPSLLACDFSRLGEEIRRAEDAGADMLHCDIMDGHFVPNLTFGPPVLASIRRVTRLPLDVHLMLNNAHQFIEPFAQAGADALTVHLEVYPDPTEILERIGALGKLRGLSINPDMPVERVKPFLAHVDRFLLMSVFPGFGGQSFIESSYERLREFRRLPGAERIDLQIDGGIGPANAAKVVAAGASNLVAGSSTFGAPDMAEAIRRMRGS